MATTRFGILPGLAALLVAGAVGAGAQQRSGTPELRNVRGQVLDATTQRPLDRVFVSLRRESGSIVEQLTTSSSGRFEFVRVPADMYYLVAELVGYQQSSQRIDVTIGAAGYLPVYLQPLAGEAPARPGGAVGMESLAAPEAARTQYERGWKALFEEKNTEAGVRHLREAIRLYPEYVEARHLLGTSYMDQKKWAEAEAELKRAVEINERFAPSQFALGVVCQELGKPAEARAALERGLQADPSSWRGHLQLAESLLAEDQLEKADEHARRAHELAPEEPMAHALLAKAHLRGQRPLEAKEELEHYLTLAPDGPLAGEARAKLAALQQGETKPTQQPGEPKFTLQEAVPRERAPAPPAAQAEYAEGQKSLQSRDAGKAMKHFRKAIELHPEFLEAHYAIGMLLMDQPQSSAETERAFQRCLEIDESYAPALAGLGALYNLEGKPAEAEAVLRRAVEADPESWLGHFELAQSLLAQKKVTQAAGHAERAHELRPEDALVHVVLGNVRLSQRNLRAARDEFQHYLEREPDGPMAAALRQKIEQLNAALEKQGAPR